MISQDFNSTPVNLADYSDADHTYLRRYCYRFTKDWHEAEDLVQTTLVKALQANFDGRCAKRTWLAFIARTEFLMNCRRQKARVNLRESLDIADHQIANHDEPPLVDIVRQRTCEQVRNAIASLNEPYRVALTAYWLEERSMKECMAELGISMPSLKARLHYGKIMLRKRLVN